LEQDFYRECADIHIFCWDWSLTTRTVEKFTSSAAAPFNFKESKIFYGAESSFDPRTFLSLRCMYMCWKGMTFLEAEIILQMSFSS